MGYYSYVSFELKLIKGVSSKDFFVAFNKEYKGDVNYDFWKEKISIEDDGSIDLQEEMKFYDYEKLARLLAPFVEGEIWVDGEESQDKWKIEFDGKGNWKEVQSELIYGYEPYKNFIEAYGDQLPKKLKEELEKWHLAKEV